MTSGYIVKGDDLLSPLFIDDGVVNGNLELSKKLSEKVLSVPDVSELP